MLKVVQLRLVTGKLIVQIVICLKSQLNYDIIHVIDEDFVEKIENCIFSIVQHALNA